MVCWRTGLFGLDMPQLIPTVHGLNIQEESIPVGLILQTSTLILVSTETNTASWFSIYWSVCLIWVLLFSHYTVPYYNTMRWTTGASVRIFLKTHLTPPSFHCDQIAKRCLTEWGWRVAYSTTERCQKAVEGDFHLTVTRDRLEFSLTFFWCVAQTPH